MFTDFMIFICIHCLEINEFSCLNKSCTKFHNCIQQKYPFYDFSFILKCAHNKTMLDNKRFVSYIVEYYITSNKISD